MAPSSEKRVASSLPAPPLQIPLRTSKGQALGKPKIRRAVSQRLLHDDLSWMPTWLQLHSERGTVLKCWEGHRLFAASHDGRSHGPCQRCEKMPQAGTRVMLCRTCDWYSVCPSCIAGRRERCLPHLTDDPLFQGPDSSCLLLPPSTPKFQGRGTVIVCPGGNYEFLCGNEGMPVAEWLMRHGINAMVLRYRLMPRHSPERALHDLAEAVRVARKLRPGPVAAIGFSAGGHLVASYSQRYRAPRVSRRKSLLQGRLARFCSKKFHIKSSHSKHRCSRKRHLDAQVLVYPGIDGADWEDPDESGFLQNEECMAHVPTLMKGQRALMGGQGFAAPPSFLVGSTGDEVCPARAHTDVYAEALAKRGIPYHYLRRNFGSHGFALYGGWTKQCIKWLQASGFGGPGSGERLATP